MSSPIFQLPPDIFRAIGRYIDAHLLIKLWFCGDKTLNYVLGRPGFVEHILLHFEEEHKVHWPNFISNFPHLESLTLRISPGHKTTTFSELNVSSIPSQIGHLDIICPSLCSTSSDPSDPPPWSQILSSLLRFPKLRFLRLSASVRSVEIIHVASFDVNFPSQLSTLFLNFDVSFHCSILKKLPNTLIRLEIGLFADTESLQQVSFPPNLTWLRTHDIQPDILLPALPRSLIELRIISRLITEAIKPVEWSSFPPLLETLVISVHFDEAFAKALPRSLTELRHQFLTINDIDSVQYLPPSLTIWETPQIPLIRDQAEYARFISTLPTTLKYLPNLSYLRIELSHLHSLPQNLQKVSVSGSLKEPNPPSLNCLPHNLHTLEARDLPVELLGTLPPKLTQLRASLLADQVDPLTFLKPYPLSEISLTNSTPSRSSSTAKAFEHLPSTVTTLRLRLRTDLNAIDWTHPWCQSLTSFEALPSSPITNSHKWFSTLPRRLTSLDLTDAISQPPDCLRFLPPNLVKLTLGVSQAITDEHLSLLPRTLVLLRLVCSPMRADFTPAGLENLPSTLTSFHLTQSQHFGPNDVIPHFPVLKNWRIGSRQEFL